MGTAYAVWTGIGAVGTLITGILLYGEPANFLRLGSLGTPSPALSRMPTCLTTHPTITCATGDVTPAVEPELAAAIEAATDFNARTQRQSAQEVQYGQPEWASALVSTTASRYTSLVRPPPSLPARAQGRDSGGVLAALFPFAK